MIRLFLFIRLAVRNLRRGGQRILVALACITFGIMALVAMMMLANSIESKVVLTPAQMLGADISMGRKVEDTVSAGDLAQLDGLLQSGVISRYTQIAFSSSILVHKPDSSEMHYVGGTLGIEAEKYPLAGTLTIGEPGSTGLATLLQETGDVVITRDLAEAYKLKVGDPIVLADPRIGIPLNATIRGVAYDTPNHMGDKIYFSIATAQALANGQPVVNTVMVNSENAGNAVQVLESSGWSVDWSAANRDDKTDNLWTLGLRGAGILGLLVGGVGIADTMQVLLRRRQKEIAIWKTLGYREGDLRLIIALEAGVLGLAGSLLGAVLGVVISTGLLEVFRRTSSLLYEWTFSLTPPLMGVLVGTLSTEIFAYWAIVMTGQASPMALLRNERLDVRRIAGFKSVLLVLLLMVPFTALTSLVMGSILSGIGMFAGILVGMALLGGFFSGLLWLCTHVIPVKRFPLARMAFNNLRRRGTALVFAMIALFAGILSLSLGVLVVQTSLSKTTMGIPEFPGYNMILLAGADQEGAIRQAVQAEHPLAMGVGYQATLAGVNAQGTPIRGMDAVLMGSSDSQGYILDGAAWGSVMDGVYVPQGSDLQAGRQVEAVFRDGSRQVYTVVGTYMQNYQATSLFPPMGLLISEDGFKRTAMADLLRISVQMAPSQLHEAAGNLMSALPQATVVDLAAYAGRFTEYYRNLFVVPLVMAGLALLAGLLLVANSVSLAMLDRRYEIGILKTVGYSRRQILSIFGVEYGAVGLLSSGAGVLLIQAFLALFAISNRMPVSTLLLSIPALALVAACGVGLTLLTVLSVTRKPTLVSPVAILNDRS